MSARAHPLDSVVEALAFYAEQGNYAVSGGQSVLGTLSLHMGNIHTDGGDRARAALQVARQMRESAVVGWVSKGGAAFLAEGSYRKAFIHNYCDDPAHYVPLYALPVPDAEPTTEGETDHGE